MEVCIKDNQDGTYTVDVEASEEREPSGNEQTFQSIEEAFTAAKGLLDQASMAPSDDASQIAPEPDEGMPSEEMAPTEEEDAMTGSFKPQRPPVKPTMR